MTIDTFIDSLRTVAASPLALIAYSVVVSAWVARSWLAHRPQARAKEILLAYTSDSQRTRALEGLLGSRPPHGLQTSQILDWVRIESHHKTRSLLLVAYVATLLTMVLVVGIAVYQAKTVVDTSVPQLIDTRIVRPQ
jgi:hypothetical protein